MKISDAQIEGLFLFKSLIKDGCTWQGDIDSRKWSECLYFVEGLRHQVDLTLESYDEGVEYKREGNAIWIA